MREEAWWRSARPAQGDHALPAGAGEGVAQFRRADVGIHAHPLGGDPGVLDGIGQGADRDEVDGLPDGTEVHGFR
ncbi:hypothetical protein ACFWBB_12015 [Streptomyces sp. NPDC060000]|uniref:hypothetical protein n=1 Tax=Streptomyces sp. NPDC060000 TaxID=3347031 RepID=UPI0036CA38CE